VVIGEIARVLKAGGRFLGRRHRRGSNHADFDLDALGPALEAAGLRIVDRGEVGQKLVRGLSNLRFIATEAA
jgi:hypothetical protein